MFRTALPPPARPTTAQVRVRRCLDSETSILATLYPKLRAEVYAELCECNLRLRTSACIGYGWSKAVYHRACRRADVPVLRLACEALIFRIEHAHTPGSPLTWSNTVHGHLDSVTLARPHVPATTAQLLGGARCRRQKGVACGVLEHKIHCNTRFLRSSRWDGPVGPNGNDGKIDRGLLPHRTPYSSWTRPMWIRPSRTSQRPRMSAGVVPGSVLVALRIYPTAAARQAAYRTRKRHSEDPPTSL